MTILFQYRIHRQDLDHNPKVLYVFGDNDVRRGYGGQAGECRGCKNAVGIRVKKYPTLLPNAYYTDEEYEWNCEKIAEDFERLFRAVWDGKLVVYPLEGVGTGLADLRVKAPNTCKYLKDLLAKLIEASRQLQNKEKSSSG